MRELDLRSTRIVDSFSGPRLLANAQKALQHQREQLEERGCIDNFRPLAPPQGAGAPRKPALGHCSQGAYYLRAHRTWSPGDIIDIEWPLPIVASRAHSRVRSGWGRVALSGGALVYCPESVDNPNLDLFNTQIDLGTLRAEHSPDHLGGIWLLRGEMKREETFCAIPLLCLGQPGSVGNGSVASSLALAQSKHGR